MPQASRQLRRQGFTLIEMIVVLVILGLILGIVVAHGPLHSQRLDMDGAARQLAGALRLARSQAIAQNRTVSLLLAAGAYRLDNEGPQALPAGLRLTGSPTIAFASDGSSSGGVVELYGGDRHIAITVDWLTGHVRVGSRE